MSDRPWDDARLLEWILNPARRDPAQGVGIDADPGLRARREELTAFLATCREALGPDVYHSVYLRAYPRAYPRADPEELAQEVLARTTREDLTWRGDLRLLGGYLRGRLRASAWLRVAAASLLVHLVALPVLAYYVIFTPAQPFDLTFEPAPESDYGEVSEPDLPLPVPDLLEEPAVREVDPGVGGPDPEDGPEDGPEDDPRDDR